MLPFTREQFFELFALYNSANWQAVLIAYPLALTAIVAAWRDTRSGRQLAALILALMWGWVGLVYHGIYFSRINPIATLFAAAFVVQAVLLGGHAIGNGGLLLKRPQSAPVIGGAILILYATIVYPLIGFAVGEQYPAMPWFGVSPCPLVIFTVGLLAWGRAPWPLWIIPLIWSAVGGSASLLLSVPQDTALPLSAVAAVLVRLLDRADSPNALRTFRR